MLFTACDEIEQIMKPSVNYYFGSPRIETTETSAKIIIDQPYAAVDGQIYNEAVITLGYVRTEDQFVEELTIVEEYETKDSVIIFTINDLEPATNYIAYTFIDAGEHGSKKSEAYHFNTDIHTPEYTALCRVSVEAKGIMAAVTLSEAAYLVDDKEVPFSNVRVEYARKRSELEWVGIDIAGDSFSDDTETIAIPVEGADFLEEYSPYLYRLIFTPADDQFPTITTESGEFETEYAEVTAEISTPDVTIVGDNIENPVVLSIREAIKLADEMELDLIEISPKADPPVCRIADYQKFLYQLKRKAKEIKANQTKVVIKEIRFGPQTDDHDYNFKLKHAQNFLKEGAKVKAYVFFRGRSIVFKEQGEILLLRFATDLEEVAKVEMMPKLDGKKMNMILAPKGTKK